MIAEQLRRLAGIELRELQGSTASAEVPLPVTVVNRLIARKLSGTGGPIGAVTLDAHDGQRFTATLSMRGQSLIPSVRIAARIVQQPEFPGRPVLVLQWTVPGFGPLARFASPALSFFKGLPQGIRVDGDHVLVDLSQVARAHGYGDVLDLVAGLNVQTREGVFLIRLDARV